MAAPKYQLPDDLKDLYVPTIAPDGQLRAVQVQPVPGPELQHSFSAVWGCEEYGVLLEGQQYAVQEPLLCSKDEADELIAAASQKPAKRRDLFLLSATAAGMAPGLSSGTQCKLVLPSMHCNI